MISVALARLDPRRYSNLLKSLHFHRQIRELFIVPGVEDLLVFNYFCNSKDIMQSLKFCFIFKEHVDSKILCFFLTKIMSYVV